MIKQVQMTPTGKQMTSSQTKKNTYWNWCLRILGECGKNVGEKQHFDVIRSMSQIPFRR